MTTLTRVFAKQFGSQAPLNEIGVFGSAKALNPQRSKDITEIQSLPAYTQGWGSAVVSADNFPPMEEVTGVLNTLSYQICYLLQEGIPVYNSETEYSNTSIVKVVNGTQVDFYLSQADGNQGNALNTAWWRRADIVSTREVGVPQMTLNSNLTLPDNCIWLEGQYDDLTNPDFPALKNIYGTVYNTDDTPAGKYSLPDFRNKYICGLGVDEHGDTDTQMGYIDAGLPSLTVSSVSNHTHGVGSYHIYGRMNNVSRTSARVPAGETSGCCNVESSSITSSGFYSQTNSFGQTIIIRAGADGTVYGNAQYGGFYGVSGASGSHNHTISSPLIDSTLNTVKVDGIKVRVYTRFE